MRFERLSVTGYGDSSDNDFQKPLKQLKKSSDKKLKSASVVGISSKGLVPYDEEKTIRIRNSAITLCKLVQFGKLKNPTMKDVVITEKDTREQIQERSRSQQYHFLKINKLSADDEEKEKEKEVETETVKVDRKRKGGDKEEKEQEKEKRDISKQHSNEVVTNETTQGEGGKDGEKKEEKGNEKKPAQEEKTEKGQRVIQKVADPVIGKPKQMENLGSSKKSGSRFDFARAVQGAKAGKTSGSKPSVPASTGSVLPGLQTTGKDEKPAKGKGREGNEEKPAQVKKVKEVDARKGKVDEQKVVAEDDAEQKKNAARATRPAEALCSPYVQRVVQLNTKRENIEDIIAEWIFASIKDPWIFVFQNAKGTSIPRICMESFHPN
ncbi:hypothetical protein L1987_48111 [Smallanthus sonchifolius]|uniref:Uncharacterized protein n=1 Tax=Smallanthus sonchifolius TaxID=185202 RepID=A0ACB9FRZ5_9ASTR|nr:hypothetical protein L1987_48111 [Smallanthus sonchifolius]